MFVSHAQQQEDVILWRALGDVKGGCYLDVGAAHPVEDSVSAAFYERGWRGINIEPVESLHRLLMEHRREDVNLPVAVADMAGTRVLYEVEQTGLSTLIEAHALRHVEAGHSVRTRPVSVVTLDEILRDHPLPAVHFLKMDVEGAEREALLGLNLETTRPWVIVIEATEPNRQVFTHETWEHLLTTRSYEFVHADGLNRFYLASEHGRLRGAFEYPPNFFDGYLRHSEVLAAGARQEPDGRLAMLTRELSLAQQTVARCRVELECAGEMEARAAHLDEQVKSLHQRLAAQRQKYDVLKLQAAEWKGKAVMKDKELGIMQRGWWGKVTRPFWKRRLQKLKKPEPPAKPAVASEKPASKPDGVATLETLSEPARDIYRELERQMRGREGGES
jgi:FkbM family methyltransferase